MTKNSNFIFFHSKCLNYFVAQFTIYLYGNIIAKTTTVCGSIHTHTHTHTLTLQQQQQHYVDQYTTTLVCIGSN